MKLVRFFIASALAAVAASNSRAVSRADFARVTPVAATEPIPALDFFREPIFRAPALNRAGTHLAALISAGDDHVQLLIQDLATQKFEFLNGLEELDITDFVWLDDRHILFVCGGTELFVADVTDIKHSYRVYYCWPHIVDVPEANRMRPLLWVEADPFDTMGRSTGVIALKAELADTRPITWSGNDMAMLTYRELNQEHTAIQYPVPPGGIDAGYMADKDGALAFGYTSKDGLLTLHRFVDGAWQKCPVDVEERRVIAPGNKPGEVVVIAQHPTGTPSSLQFMDAASGELREVLVQDKDYDFDGSLFRDPASHDVVGAMYERAAPQTIWFSEAYRNLQKTVDGYFPNTVVQILQGDRNGKRFVLRTWSDRQPISYHLLDLEKNAVGLIKQSRPWIDPKRMQDTKLMKYKTRDGQKLDAYVTLPAGAAKDHPVPLIVLLESGLWSRASVGFDPETQYFVSRGYAVLRPNHRWSNGYGWMFPREDEWAFDKMARDVNDATTALLKSGVIDRQRIAIKGSYFGANFALTAVVNAPDLYRVAIANRGIFDFVQFVKEWKYYQHIDASYGTLVRKLGDPKRDSEKLNAMSPARHVDQIHIPVFVAAHRENASETVVQSTSLLSELSRHNVPHEELWFTGGIHGLQNIENNLTLYSRIDAFLGKYMPEK